MVSTDETNQSENIRFILTFECYLLHSQKETKTDKREKDKTRKLSKINKKV